ncbi:hypothetical protein P7H75_05795 [Vagococcus carniphilus]|nr:hypothetical protein [Vagococcus carniphilus]MDT2814352.1 hypothetical protein [Vagococcus carniphilus]
MSNEWKEILKNKLKNNAELHEAKRNMSKEFIKASRQLNKARKELSS